jgi:hypothetical protein
MKEGLSCLADEGRPICLADERRPIMFSSWENENTRGGGLLTLGFKMGNKFEELDRVERWNICF